MRNIFILSFYFLLSCTKAVDFEPSFEKQVVVNCVLDGQSSVQRLTLSYSNTLSDFYYERITEAKITLYADDIPVGDFRVDEYNEWYLNYRPLTGKTYRLTVEIPGESLIEATTTMPARIPVKHIAGTDLPDAFMQKYFFQEAYDCAYWIFVMSKTVETTRPAEKEQLQMSLGTDHTDCDRFNMSGSMMSSSFGSNYLSLEQIAYLRITPQTGKSYRFYVEAPVGNSWHCFRAASAEYDKYLKTSVQKMLVYQSFDDPSQWFDENTVYSNIQNGLGIFGAYTDMFIETTVNPRY